jgi:hypothetical protein
MKPIDRSGIRSTMRTTLLRNMVRAAAGSMLVLAAVTAALEQLEMRAHSTSHLTQFCAPPQEDSEAPRFYCSNDYG